MRYNRCEPFVQPALTTAMKALRKMTGSTRLNKVARSLSGRTGGGPTWALKEEKTRNRAAAWASAAISGPELSGGVRSPTICEEAELATSVGVH